MLRFLILISGGVQAPMGAPEHEQSAYVGLADESEIQSDRLGML